MATHPTPSIRLSVEALSYRYRGREEWALRDVSFTASQGELVLIAGASGCGKTTLIRCLNGLIPKSYKGGELTGDIRVESAESGIRELRTDGTDGTASSRTPERRGAGTPHAFLVGTVLQDPERQIVGSRVANEVAFGLENLGVPRPEMRRRVADVLDHLGIGDLAERETASLSGGEKQKVAIAGALVMQPAVLLLDEPLANLDPASAREALRLFRSLADEGRILLIVEHRVEDVLAIHPQSALYLCEGRPEYFGPLDGFLKVADPREVKLPARLAVAKLRDLGVQASGRSGVPDEIVPSVPSVPPTQTTEPPKAPTPDRIPPLVEFDRVTFAYELSAPVLREVTTAIHEGDVIAVLGPNGAGKSTLLKHAIGLLKPTTGSVRVSGKDTRAQTTAELARTVGYVFQSPAHMLFANSVREELAFGPRNLGLTEELVAANSALALESMDLAGFEERAPLALSFGQQKRVGIAAILAMEPRILVMDEPTAGQDYRHYTEFLRVVLSRRDPAHRAPLAALAFITHDLDLAITYSNRVWLIVDGRLLADGSVETVLREEHLLASAKLHPTSLLELNRERLPREARFSSLEGIAAEAE